MNKETPKIVMKRELLDLILEDGKKRYPAEACGIILGKVQDNVFVARELRSARNLSDDPIRFILDPRDFMRIQEEADKSGLEIIGIYHTHPEHPPIASQYDLEAAIEGLVYVIMSVWKDGLGDAKAYVLSEKRTFVEIQMETR